MSVDLRLLQMEVTDWQRKNFGITPPHRPLLGMQEEIGELSHAHLKAEQNIRGTKEEHRQAKIDALGDLIIFALNYADLNEIVLDGAIQITWDQVKQRDWIKFPKNGKTE